MLGFKVMLDSWLGSIRDTLPGLSQQICRLKLPHVSFVEVRGYTGQTLGSCSHFDGHLSAVYV